MKTKGEGGFATLPPVPPSAANLHPNHKTKQLIHICSTPLSSSIIIMIIIDDDDNNNNNKYDVDDEDNKTTKQQ
jgi:hypothetical protein